MRGLPNSMPVRRGGPGCLWSLKPRQYALTPPHSRPFFWPATSAPTTTPQEPIRQSYSARRVLPYPRPGLYNIVSDIAAYADFIPGCSGARVTAWSAPDGQSQRRWPARATLDIGLGGGGGRSSGGRSSSSGGGSTLFGSLPFPEESFQSRVYCVPDRFVEAIAGEGVSSLPKAELGHYADSEKEGRTLDDERHNGALRDSKFTTLRTRWRLKDAAGEDIEGGPRTEVDLAIDVFWTSQKLATLSGIFAPNMADRMVEAFETRAEKLLGGRRR